MTLVSELQERKGLLKVICVAISGVLEPGMCTLFASKACAATQHQ